MSIFVFVQLFFNKQWIFIIIMVHILSAFRFWLAELYFNIRYLDVIICVLILLRVLRWDFGYLLQTGKFDVCRRHYITLRLILRLILRRIDIALSSTDNFLIWCNLSSILITQNLILLRIHFHYWMISRKRSPKWIWIRGFVLGISRVVRLLRRLLIVCSIYQVDILWSKLNIIECSVAPSLTILLVNISLISHIDRLIFTLVAGLWFFLLNNIFQRFITHKEGFFIFWLLFTLW